MLRGLVMSRKSVFENIGTVFFFPSLETVQEPESHEDQQK